MSKPMVSVIMGVYYRCPDTALLRRSVHSMLNQSVSGLELLVCDDGSCREASELLDQMAQGDSRLRLIRPGDAFTLPQKLNACLKEVHGRWVARMDDDDFSHSQRLECQIEYLEGHPEIDFVGCNVNLIRDGEKVGERHFPEYPTVRNFYMTQPYIHPALLFRRETLLRIGGYSEEKSVILCEDYDLLLRLYAAKSVGANLQKVLLDYTIPTTAKGKRRMRYRWNEVITRWRRFKELNVLARAWPFVIKPLAVGLMPEWLLKKVKQYQCERHRIEKSGSGKKY